MQAIRLHAIPGVWLLLNSSVGLSATYPVGPGKTYSTIQEAVNAAAASDVFAGLDNQAPASLVDIVVFAESGGYAEMVTIPQDATVGQSGNGGDPAFNGPNDRWTIRCNSGDSVWLRGGFVIGRDRDNFVFNGINVQLTTGAGFNFGQTARSCTIRNAIITGKNNNAAVAGSNWYGTNTLDHATIYATDYGISAGYASSVFVSNSIVAFCTYYGHYATDASGISYSDIFGCNPNIHAGSGAYNSGNNLNYPAGADPQFVSTTRTDAEYLWLKSTSPALGSAASAGAFTSGQFNMGAMPSETALTGACCLPNGVCAETTADWCGGAFHGQGTSCAATNCQPPAVPSTCPLLAGMQTVSFTRFAQNPIIRPSIDQYPSGIWTDNMDTLHQCVARKDAGSPYMMWYTGDSNHDYPRRIHLATSNDGITWTKYGMVLGPGATGAFDDVQIEMPSVLWKDGQWKMWYCGHRQTNCSPCTPQQSAGWITVGYASSLDGIVWTKYGRVFDVNPDLGAFDSDTVREPTVIYDDADHLYKMWYDGTQFGQHYGPVGYATSADGIHWTRIAQVSQTEDRLRGGAIKVGDYIYMFYNIGNTFGYSVSRNGIDWVDYSANPVMSPLSGTWENQYLQAPSEVYDPALGRLYLYYNAFDGVSEKIGGAWTNFGAYTLPSSFIGDFEGDTDVDMTDFGAIQRCMGQAASGGCAAVDLNCDHQIDQQDATLFLNCMSGPDVPANPNCAQ